MPRLLRGERRCVVTGNVERREVLRGYEPLARVLDDALEQAQRGKGAVRHASPGESFWTSVGFLPGCGVSLASGTTASPCFFFSSWTFLSCATFRGSAMISPMHCCRLNGSRR